MPSQNPRTETHLKKAIYKALEPFANCYRRKLSNPFRAGVLDLFVCFQGRCVWFENKVLPNKLTPLQKKEMQEIKRAGGLAYGIFAEPDFSAFYLYREDFDVVEFGNLTDLLIAALMR
jgi:hypothetical protein